MNHVPERHCANVCFRADRWRHPGLRKRGGGGGNSRRFPACRVAPAAFAAVLAALAVAPSATVAQTCTSAPTVAGTPSAAPSAWTFGGTLSSTGTGIECNTLTNGLAMTLGPDLAMGTEGTPLTTGISVDAEGDGDSDVTVTGAAVIHASSSGIYMKRDGTGLLGLELTGGRIVGSRIELRHKGKENMDSKGVRIVSGADIDLSGNTSAGKTGIYITTEGAPAASGRATTTVPVTVRFTGGTIDAQEYALRVIQDAKGDIDITVEPEASLGREGSVAAIAGIDVSLDSVAEGDIAITHRGRIYGGHGMDVSNGSTSERKGNITITTAPGSVTVAKGDPKHGILTWISENGSTGDITIVHNGSLEGGRSGIYTYNSGKGDVSVTTGTGSAIVARGTQDGASGIRAGVWENLSDQSARTHGGGDLTIVHRGTITAKGAGIRAYNRVVGAKGTGTIDVTTERGSRVVAERQGIVVWHEGSGKSTVTVRGTVRGDSAYKDGSDTKYAGVRVEANQQTPKTLRGADAEGGVIVIGPRAHVSSGSGTAVMIDAGTGKWALVLERDRYGLAGHVEGTVLNPAATAFSARTGETGAETALKVGDRVDMRGETAGVFDAVHRTRLETVTGGHEFKKLSETRVYHDRARVYEALPSVLLDLVRPASLAGRASVPLGGAAATRGTAGGGGRVWARLEAGDGKRRAAASTTGKGYRGVALAWDTERRSVEAGLELPAGDRLALGLGVRHLRGKATVKGGGRIDVSGLGLGLSVAHTGAGGLYIDGRLSHTRFGDIDLASDARGSVVSNLSGDGFAAGVGVGRRIAREGVALTPRGGLAWSSVSLGAFDDVAGVEGGGRVVPGRTRSLVGGLGVLAEFGGSEGSSGRAFASLDLEREFSPDREVVASGTGLSSKVRATWVRLGLGGALDLGSSGAVRLSGRGHYATAGSGNTGYGGSVTLTLRF